MLKKAITLKDISQKLNLTQTTISKALRGHPDISRETRTRVVQTANELGYVPNIHASILSSRKSRTVGLIIPYIADAYYSGITESAFKNANLHGFDVTLAITYDDDQREDIQIRKMLANKVEALIISGEVNNSVANIYELLINCDTPVVFIPASPDRAGMKDLSEELVASFKVLEQAIRIGYRRIISICGSNEGEKNTGFAAAVEKYKNIAGLSFQSIICNDEESVYFAFRKLSELAALPELFITDQGYALAGISRAIGDDAGNRTEKFETMFFGRKTEETILIPADCLERTTNSGDLKGMDLLFSLLDSGPNQFKKIG